MVAQFSSEYAFKLNTLCKNRSQHKVLESFSLMNKGLANYQLQKQKFTYLKKSVLPILSTAVLC